MLNFGIIKNKVSQLVGEHYLNENHAQAEAVYRDYMTTVKNSDILMLEYIVFKNLEKTGLTESVAHAYVDNNVAMLSKFKKSDIIAEHKKLAPFELKTITVKDENIALNESIQNLILENAQTDRMRNINKLHESLCVVLENLSKPSGKKMVSEASNPLSKYSFKTVMAAVKKTIAASYQELNESEQSVLAVLMEKDGQKQTVLFEELKQKGIAFIKENLDDQPSRDFAIGKIQDMPLTSDNVLNLFEMMGDGE